MADDTAIVTRIGELIEEGRRVRASAPRGEGLSTEERRLLAELEAEQDRFWDQLRRRRSRRYFGDQADEVATTRVGPPRAMSRRGLTGRRPSER
jgi:hypothetical protein